MRTTRLNVAILATVVAATTGLATALPAQATDPYPATLYFGTGLIDIPVAWVSPTSGDVWVQFSQKRIPWNPDVSKMNFATIWNQNVSIDTHWRRRFSAGLSLYDQNVDYGFFGQAMLVREDDYAGLPGLAVGVRNIGPETHEDRLLQAEDVCLVGTRYVHCTHGENMNFRTNNTVFGVATKTFTLGTMASVTPPASLSLSIGYGNGLFSEDGGLGARYSKSGTVARGLFFGARTAFHPSLNSTLNVMAENNGFDYNAGVVLDVRGITAGIYGSELDKGGSRDPASFYLYNYRKVSVSVGYSGNILDISRGQILRARVTELTREQERLRFEIAARERRIRGLEVVLNKAQTGEVANIQKRREETETQVQAEREAIRRAEERLRQIQEGQAPTPTNPPPANPPATPPANPPGSPSPSGGSTPPSTQS